MISDPILDEIHAYRAELARRFNYDLGAIVDHLCEQERLSGQPVVTAPPVRKLVTPLMGPASAEVAAAPAESIT